jgi:hypothetical protein
VDEHQIPEPVRAAVLSRVEQYGVGPTALGQELLMAEGCASFADFIANIDHRYGIDEGARVAETIHRLSYRDVQTLGLDGRQGLGEIRRAQALAENLPRYALIAAPDAEFVNGVEIAVAMITAKYSTAGSARGTEIADEVLEKIDELFAKRAIPYRCQDGKLVWAGDRGAAELVVRPALDSLGNPRLAGARSEFDAALAHLRAGTLKDREDAIEEAAKSVESALKVLAAETATNVATNATVRPLFDALKRAGVLPDYSDNLVQSAARIRNQLGGHGAGEQPRQIAGADAVAAINAAAAALVYLAAHLP